MWRGFIGAAASDALDDAAGLGLRVRPAKGLGWIGSGRLDGIEVRIAWMGGIRGERTLLNIGGLKRTMPLITSAHGLRSALASPEE